MFTDSHCHLADPQLLPRLPQVLAQAEAAGVCRFIVPATCGTDFAAVAALKHPAIHLAFGIHPWFTAQAGADDMQALESRLLAHPNALVGEIGLDFHANNLIKSDKAQQTDYFVQQLALAQRLRRPAIVHNLKATVAVVEAVQRSGFKQGGIVHAFSGSLEEAKMLIKCGFMIGIGSLLLNPAARKARAAAAQLPLEYLVLETDSPFMSVKQQGANTPANVRRIAETMAALRGVPLAALAAETENNINRLLSFR